MSTYALGIGLRLGRLAAVLLVVSTLCFFSLALTPGDPARLMLGEASATPEAVATLRAELGLDEGLPHRYGTWLTATVQGDLGQSYRTGEPVTSIVRDRVPVTLELIAWSQLLSLVLAVPAAVVAASRRDSRTDRRISFWAFTALSTPDFVIGISLIWIFAVTFGIFPAGGYVPWSGGAGPHLASLAMPALALSTASFAVYQRVLRADLGETLQRDYVTTARAMGLSPFRVTVRHVLRPSLLGLTTMIGVTIGTMLGSTVVVETLFGVPGLAAELASAVSGRDYIEVQGLVLVIATIVVLIGALVDVLSGVIDPRLRLDESSATRGSR